VKDDLLTTKHPHFAHSALKHICLTQSQSVKAPKATLGAAGEALGTA
jgi:hypothetical protein